MVLGVWAVSIAAIALSSTYREQINEFMHRDTLFELAGVLSVQSSLNYWRNGKCRPGGWSRGLCRNSSGGVRCVAARAVLAESQRVFAEDWDVKTANEIACVVFEAEAPE